MEGRIVLELNGRVMDRDWGGISPVRFLLVMSLFGAFHMWYSVTCIVGIGNFMTLMLWRCHLNEAKNI